MRRAEAQDLRAHELVRTKVLRLRRHRADGCASVAWAFFLGVGCVLLPITPTPGSIPVVAGGSIVVVTMLGRRISVTRRLDDAPSGEAPQGEAVRADATAAR